MRSRNSKYGAILTTTLGALLALMTTAEPAFAGLPAKGKSVHAPLAGGNVLPGLAQPKGYSLLTLAEETAAFNVTDRSGPPPALPFQMLYSRPGNTNTFEVRAGTM